MATKTKLHPAAAVWHSPNQARAGKRLRWVDTTRGLAIVLVVLGHAAGGLIDASGPGTVPALRYFFLAIYSFHMPVFFFLAGLFVEQRLQRGTTSFLVRLLQTLVYPYFLWAGIQYSVIFALGSLVNHPASTYWDSILSLPWKPISQFWFLYALFLIHLFSVAAWRLGGVGAILCAALLVKFAAMMVPSGAALSLAASNAPYYAIGACLGWRRVSTLIESASIALRSMWIFAAVGALALLCSQANTIQTAVTVETANAAGLAKLAWSPVVTPVALLCGAALLMIAERISRVNGRLPGLIERLGVATMPIFLLHVMCIAGLRIFLEKSFGLGGASVLPLLVIAGLLGPFLARELALRLRLTHVLALR